MNILVVCNWGKNRSRYLAQYLQQQGYTVQYGGIYPESDNPIHQEQVDWATVLIFVQPQTQEDFKKSFKITRQQVVTLDVEDRVSVFAPEKDELSPEEWTQIQQEKVYPELEKQISKYLPFTE